MQRIRDFIDTARDAKSIMESDASWETKYELVFSDIIKGVISSTGIEMDWCDPDASYEDDVRAYVNALSEKADELSKAIENIMA